MAKDLVQNVKGTRDFYPEDKAFQNWLYQKIRKVSERFGYQEFDGPEIEYMDLYADKTSEEILRDQAFTMKDKDERTLMLRPELTPTFARMVAEKANVLLKPIRWWMFGRCWRYEKPQRGRGREFFQWEINILGPEQPEADAEIIAVAVQLFKELGLSSDEIVIRLSDRSYFNYILDENNIGEDKYLPLLRIVDRKEKISADEFNSLLASEGLDDKQIEALNRYFNSNDYQESDWLIRLFDALESYPDVLDYVKYDPTIARGFDYYTRTVFEAWDKTGGLKRALFGGGRFDNLTETIGGDRVPGVGMAPGDMPIKEILEQFGKMPQLNVKCAEVLVTVFNQDLIYKSLECAAMLREAGIDTECGVDAEVRLEKQLKYADQKGIPFVVIIGPDEAEVNQVMLKDLKNKSQEKMELNELVGKLK